MNSEMLIELGRVVFINYGEDSGKLGVVVDIINEKRIVIDGPGLGLSRKVISCKRLELTNLKLNGVNSNTKQGELAKKIKSGKV